MDSSVVMSDAAASSDYFSPEAKPKAKPASKKATAAPKPKAAPKATIQTKLKTTATKKRKVDSDEENTQHDEDDSLLSNNADTTPPKAKKAKVAPAAKKSSGKPLEQMDNESHGVDSASAPSKSKKTGTEQYQKVSSPAATPLPLLTVSKITQLEHILKRPDTYIGSVETTEAKMWVFNSETESMESREVNYVPGLYKIFDEIMVNAADNKQRDKNMDEIRVVVDKEHGFISVENNGRGIPVEMHEVSIRYRDRSCH
jgi:DNA topoisomerase-2